MIWWYGYIYDRKIFYQWNSRKHIAQRKRILKKNNGEKTLTHRETKSNFLTVLP